MCESKIAKRWVKNDDYFGMRVRELQMHYTYRGPKLKLKRGRGLVGFKD